MSNQLVEVIDKVQQRFVKVAPTSMLFDKEKGFALSLLNSNSYLASAAQANPASLAQAIASIAAIGLSLNPAEKQAYLITRNIKQGEKWTTFVCLEPSYQGLCKLATDSGAIKWVQANCVYSADTFVDNGPGEKPTHTYSAFAKEDDRGDFVGVYCVAKTSEGDYLTSIMTAEEVYSIMERSETVKDARKKKRELYGPWVNDFREMAKKACVRRAFKMWPRSTGTRMAEAVEISNLNEGFEPILTSPNMGNYTADQKGLFDQLIEQGDAVGMYVFQQTLGSDTVFTNLYHSFEKGQKGKYQRVIDELMAKGRSLLEDCVNEFVRGVDEGDDLAIREIIGEMSADALEIAINRCPAAVITEVRKLMTEEAA